MIGSKKDDFLGEVYIEVLQLEVLQEVLGLNELHVQTDNPTLVGEVGLELEPLQLLQVLGEGFLFEGLDLLPVTRDTVRSSGCSGSRGTPVGSQSSVSGTSVGSGCC